jgi:protein tyrosine/serine phosphatase
VAVSIGVQGPANSYGLSGFAVKEFLKKRKVALLSVAAGVLLCGAAFGGYIGYLQLSGNFHTVIGGQLYRSAQLSPDALEKRVRAKGINTIINLRGENPDAQWYNSEIATAKKLGVEHIDFAMSSGTVLTPERADQLIAIMKAAPKPILIHCQSGADRTGLVSVIYSQQIAGINEDVAERQLSFRYGHVAIPHVSSVYAMDVSWHRLETHFGLKG